MGNCRCGTTWTGHRTEHCPSCHATFTGTTAGDRHRTGDHAITRGPDRRRCRTEAEMLEAGLTPRVTKTGLEVWGLPAPESPILAFASLICGPNSTSVDPSTREDFEAVTEMEGTA